MIKNFKKGNKMKAGIVGLALHIKAFLSANLAVDKLP